MKNESWKVFLACAFGACIGTLVAMRANHWFWWIGLIAGGLTGYLSYEWRTVAGAIPQAYRATRKPENASLFKFIFWSAASFICVLSWASVCAGLVWLADFTSNLHGIIACVFCVFSTLAVIITGLISVGLLLLIMAEIGCDLEEFQKPTPSDYFMTKVATRLQEQCFGEMKDFCYRTFAPIVIFWHFPRMVLRGSIAALNFSRAFTWKLFLLIHSEKRLLCGVDAAIGAGVGYMTHNVIIGTLAGGLIGLANYALVTERWLKPRGYLPLKS